jgi:methyl-accepting chemotaxis protein
MRSDAHAPSNPHGSSVTQLAYCRSHSPQKAIMEQHTITLVQHSWAQVLPISATAGALFYKNLFEADPSLKALFKGDMEQQAAKLMQMISAAVGKLGELDVLVPILRQLGQRHAGYGVLPAHYDVVGASLLKTLEQGLGAAFTPAVKQAWAAVYGVIAGVMTTAQAKS